MPAARGTSQMRSGQGSSSVSPRPIPSPTYFHTVTQTGSVPSCWKRIFQIRPFLRRKEILRLDRFSRMGCTYALACSWSSGSLLVQPTFGVQRYHQQSHRTAAHRLTVCAAPARPALLVHRQLPCAKFPSNVFSAATVPPVSFQTGCGHRSMGGRVACGSAAPFQSSSRRKFSSYTLPEVRHQSPHRSCAFARHTRNGLHSSGEVVPPDAGCIHPTTPPQE